jgi:MYXO-CTERM domain-containing protein
MTCSRWFIALAVSFVPSIALADLSDFGEAGGASREYSNLAAHIPWENHLGDWSDAMGAPQGDVPFAEGELTRSSATVEIDVTDLVQRWSSGELRADGFFLRAGGGTVNVHSREATNESDRPVLVIDGTALAPEADTHLDDSTYRALGESQRLSIGHTLMRFPRDMIVGRTISSAILRLTIERAYPSGASMRVRVFACRQPRVITPIERGIAADFEMDRGIADHPDVYTAVDFAGDSWTRTDPRWTGRGGTVIDASSAPDVENGFVALDGQALRAGFASGANGGLGAQFHFPDGEQPDEVYSRYYLLVGTNFEPTVDGGKMPGFAFRPVSRCNGGDPDPTGTVCWSARGGFYTVVPANNPLAGLMPLSYYVYHPDQEGAYGSSWVWNIGYNALIQQGRWYCVDEHVRVNSSPGTHDGVLRAWINGRLAFEKTDILFRQSLELHVGEVWYNIYHGGTAPAPHDMYLYLDNLVVARSYIGPMGGLPDAPPPLEDGTLVTPGTDGGPIDADGGAIAGRDATARGDGGTTSDPSATDGGCTCSAGSSDASVFAWLLIAALSRSRRRSQRMGGPHAVGAQRT